MSVSANGTNRRWVWAAGGAVFVVAAILALFSVPKPATRSTAVRTSSGIGLQKLAPGSALNDEATLLDPTPLFLPTEWNATQKELAPPEPSGSFQSFRVPPKWAFAESDFQLGRAGPTAGETKPPGSGKMHNSVGLPDPVAVPAQTAEALVPGIPGALLIGFGRSEPAVRALPPRGAMVEIVATATGQPALSDQAMAPVQTLAAAARPPGGRSWQAMEFIAAVDAAGLAAPLIMTARSGVEEVDAYFLDFLVRTLRVGERLTPGFYRISIGP